MFTNGDFSHKINTTSLFSQSSSPVAMVGKVTCQICSFPDNYTGHIDMNQMYFYLTKTTFLKSAFVAQWLEHWSCKPGVKSSNLFEG